MGEHNNRPVSLMKIFCCLFSKRETENQGIPWETLNELEKSFFETFVERMRENGLRSPIRCTTMSDGTISVTYPSVGQIGRIKLRGRKYKMQVISLKSKRTNTVDAKWINDITYEKAVSNIDKWIKYINQSV